MSCVPSPPCADDQPAPTPRVNAPTISFYFWLVKLSQEFGYCWATNGYLARVQGRSESQVVRRIAALIAAGWLRREFVNGERRLYPLVIPPAKTPRRVPTKAREKVPLRLVPAPGYAGVETEKCVPPPGKTRTPAGKGAYPYKDASGDALPDACSDNNTQADTARDAASSSEATAVVAEMEKIGVWAPTARKIACTVPVQNIRLILADPACRSARRPGAWFVTVAKTGYQQHAASTPPAPPTKQRSMAVAAEDPEAASRRETLKQAHPGLDGRALAQSVLRGLTKGLHHPVRERERPRRSGSVAEPGTCPGRGADRERAEVEGHQEECAAAERWREMQVHFAAMAAEEDRAGVPA